AEVLVDPCGLFGAEVDLGWLGVIDHVIETILVVNRCQGRPQIELRVDVAREQRYRDLRQGLIQRDRPDLSDWPLVGTAEKHEVGSEGQWFLHRDAMSLSE